MKNFFNEPCHLVFTVEGLKLLHQTLHQHCDKMIETEVLEDVEKQGTKLGREILATLRDISDSIMIKIWQTCRILSLGC